MRRFRGRGFRRGLRGRSRRYRVARVGLGGVRF